jgi:endonuclease YncB( thermonuclease family)
MKNFTHSILMFVLLFAAVPARADSDFLLRVSDGYKEIKIERILKSDAVLLEDGKKIRLIGVKGFAAPKRVGNRPADEYGFVIEDPVTDPTTSIEDQAFEFVTELLEKKRVRIEYDTKSLDENGYTYGYVFLPDGTMANTEILRQGFGELSIQPPNLKYADQLREAYREARSEKRGVHVNH